MKKEFKNSNDLTKAEIKKLANAMICQTLKCFDLTAFEDCDISEEQKEEVINLIKKDASKYENEYFNKGSIGMIIDLIKEDRKD